jgi:copper resistance protein B
MSVMSVIGAMSAIGAMGLTAAGRCTRRCGLWAVLLLVVTLPGRAVAQKAGQPKHTTSMELDREVRTFLLADVLEIQPNGPETPINLEGLAWIGGDYRRLYLRARAEQPTVGRGGGDLRADVLYGRLLTPFWSAVAGVHIDTRARAGRDVAGVAAGGRVTRANLAIGLLGIAPYWLEAEPTLYVSQDGDVAFDFETSFDLLLTQRLILQPRLELNAAIQEVPEFGVGSGLNDVELGARLRYEIRRKFAPYVGLAWYRRTGGTAAMARAAGAEVGGSVLALGVRVWR